MSNASTTASLRSRLEALTSLADLLHRVESRSTRIDADQYRLLVSRLSQALSGGLPADALEPVLRAYPAAAELYENLNFAHAGLSRAPLERLVSTELETTKLLMRIARAGGTGAAR